METAHKHKLCVRNDKTEPANNLSFQNITTRCTQKSKIAYQEGKAKPRTLTSNYGLTQLNQNHRKRSVKKKLPKLLTTTHCAVYSLFQNLGS